jgi:hypothetical protein
MPEATMHCRLCPEVTAVEDIVDHMRVMHPDVELDDALVIVDGDRTYMNSGAPVDTTAGSWMTVRWDR